MQQQPWLIQRLLQPFKDAAKGVPTVDMVFGGARGLTQDQHDVIADLFRLDSMGSAHFEGGEVPNAFYRLATNKDLRAYQIELNVKPDRKGAIGHYKLAAKTATVFMIAEPLYIQDVIAFVREEAAGINHDLKRPSDFCFAFFQAEIEPQVNYKVNAKGVCGWHDIENDYLYLLDRTMFDAIRDRFDITGDVIVVDSKAEKKASAAARKGPSIS